MIHGVKCPGCGNQSITYNGNYYCTWCSWAYPAEGSTALEREWLEVAYVRYMQQSGREPQTHHLRDIREGS